MEKTLKTSWFILNIFYDRNQISLTPSFSINNKIVAGIETKANELIIPLPISAKKTIVQTSCLCFHLSIYKYLYIYHIFFFFFFFSIRVFFHGH